MTEKTNRVFTLAGIRSREDPFQGGVVITPEPTTAEKVRDAWTHCVRYTAPGYDLVDYDAAIELLKKRYPFSLRTNYSPSQSGQITKNID